MRLGLIAAATLGVGAVLSFSLLLLDSEDAAPSVQFVGRADVESPLGPAVLSAAGAEKGVLAAPALAEPIAAGELALIEDLSKPAPDPPNLIGQIVDQDGRPVVGARVGLLPDRRALDLQRQRHRADHPDEPLPLPRLAAEVRSEKEGRFSMHTEGLRINPWSSNGEAVVLQLVVSAEHHGTVLEFVEWVGDQLTVVPPIVLDRELLITGRVLDASGRPLSGVSVRPLLWEPMRGLPWRGLGDTERQFLPSLLSVLSDERGGFTLTGLSPGAGWLGLWLDGALPWVSDRLDFTGELNTVEVGELILPLGSIISGHVLNGDGAALAGVRVVASASPYRRSDDGSVHGEFLSLVNRRQESVVMTDRAGAFVLDGLAHPLYRVYVGAAGWMAALADRVQPGTTDLEFTCTELAAVRLRVVDGGEIEVTWNDLPSLPLIDGPAPTASVRSEAALLLQGPSLSSQLRVRTGPRAGEWSVSGLAAEDLLLDVTAPGFTSWAGGPLDLPAGRDGYRYVVVRREGILQGLVHSSADGRPVVGAAVSLRSRTAGTIPQETFTDRHGAFQFSGISVGSYFVAVNRRGFVPAASETLRFDLPGQWREIMVPMAVGGDVQGSLRSRAGVPAPGRLVTATLAGQPDGASGRTARSDQQGRFHFADLPAAEHMLRVEQGAGVLVTIRPGETTEAILELMSDGVLRGRVLSQGRGLPGCVVELTSMAGKSIQSDTSDGDGEFTLRTLAQGPMTLSASSPAGVASDRIAVDLAPGIELYVDLYLSAASVSGRVDDRSSGRGIAGAVVTASSSAGEVEGRTDSLGRFHLDLLPPGDLLLRCEHPEYETSLQDIAGLGPEEKRQQLLLSLVRKPLPATLWGEALFEDGLPCFDGTVLFALPPESQWKLSPWRYHLHEDEDPSLDSEARTTTKKGRYLFEGLDPGDYKIVQEHWEMQTQARGWLRQTYVVKTVELVVGDDLQVDIVVEDG